VALTEGPLGGFTNRRESLNEKVVKVLASRKTLLEPCCPRAQRILVQRFERGLERIDGGDGFLLVFQKPVIGGAKYPPRDTA
jgi:hypothetical protein